MFDYYGYFDVCLVCGKDYPDWETEEDDICEGCLKEKIQGRIIKEVNMKQCEICYSENDGYSITRMDGYQVCIDCSEKIRKLSQEPRFGLSFGDRLTVQEFLRQTRG